MRKTFVCTQFDTQENITSDGKIKVNIVYKFHFISTSVAQAEKLRLISTASRIPEFYEIHVQIYI